MAKLDQMAMSKENWERQEKGLPLIQEPKRERPVYEPPIVPNQINLKDIDIDKFVQHWGKPKAKRNTEGVMFIGYDVEILLEKDERISGWMCEEDFLEFQRQIRGKIKKPIFPSILSNPVLPEIPVIEVSSTITAKIDKRRKENRSKSIHTRKYKPKTVVGQKVENVPAMVSNG